MSETSDPDRLRDLVFGRRLYVYAFLLWTVWLVVALIQLVFKLPLQVVVTALGAPAFVLLLWSAVRLGRGLGEPRFMRLIYAVSMLAMLVTPLFILLPMGYRARDPLIAAGYPVDTLWKSVRWAFGFETGPAGAANA